MSCILSNHVLLLHILLLNPSLNASSGVTKLSEDKKSIFEEVRPKHLTEEFKCTLQRLIKTRLLVVKYDGKSVYITDFFQTIHH